MTNATSTQMFRLQAAPYAAQPQQRAQLEESSQPGARSTDGQAEARPQEKMGLMDRGRLAMVIASEHVREHRVAYSVANFIAGCVGMMSGHPGVAVCAVPVQQGLCEM